MVATTSTGRDGWSSRSAFILAAIGSAVGLGNLVRFPAEAGANGGGAFVLFYILCIVLIGLPVLLSETLIGRHGQAASQRERWHRPRGRARAGWSAAAGHQNFRAQPRPRSPGHWIWNPSWIR